MIDTPESNGTALEALVGRVADEFTQRLNRGEQPDVEEYAARHPEAATVLRHLLPALEAMGDAPQEPSAEQERGAAVPEGAAELPLSGILGDFRIVREVGRGGMGIVYEAEQLSLKRRVALKVLPFAATMDARRLQRFHNEAQAAACLHHTNIVPVFFVGCERGVHFYAMQFIEGQSLADFLRGLSGEDREAGRDGVEQTTAIYRSGLEGAATVVAQTTAVPGPSRGRDYFRKVAELGVQAAEALDYAHQMGVVHRDVKPANLLLDGQGRLWVTDFGLAHIQHAKADLTMPGDLVGTLRYMSPEQALAKRVVIDHRTDVYSLGVTLYELLTLRPAFTGKDRQELLRQIAFDEPAAPRRLDRAIPSDLETIVCKALEKSPADRYATAEELANDLRRFLECQPIRAQKPSLVKQAKKWVQRHQGLVTAGAAVMLLALVGLSVASVLIWQARQDALEQSQRADMKAAEATTQRERTAASYRTSLATMDNALQLIFQPSQGLMDEKQRSIRKELLEQLQSLLDANADDTELGAKQADIHFYMAQLYWQQGDKENAGHSFSEAISHYRELRKDFPEDPGYRVKLLQVYTTQANLMADWIKEHITSAERTHATYLSLAENVAADFPEFRPGDCEAAWSFFASYRFLAEFLSKAGQFESAARMYRCAAEGGMRLLPGWRENGKMGPALTNLANIYAQLGQMLWRTRKAEEAIEAYRQSVGFLKSRALLTDPAARYGFYHEQARHLTALGQVFAENNRAEEAQWSYEQALALWAGLKEDEPSRMQRLLSPSQAQEGMGDLFQERGNTAAAEQAYSQVMALRERSLQVRQATAGQEKIARQELARFLASCPLDKFRDPRRAVELAQEALEKADDSDGMGAKVLGMALYRTGAWKDAVAATRKGTATRRYADGSDFFFLAMAHWQLRETEQARDFYNRGVRWMETHNPRDRELRRYRAEAETLLGVAGTTRNDKSPSARK